MSHVDPINAARTANWTVMDGKITPSPCLSGTTSARDCIRGLRERAAGGCGGVSKDIASSSLSSAARVSNAATDSDFSLYALL
jgi:hypothetical protein